ncbi:MAG: hypothetical protein ACRDHF_10000 [Tepidiformaceae bacterium]
MSPPLDALKPYQRDALERTMVASNPAELQRRIDRILRELWRPRRQEPKLIEDVG